jgi:hypothetical protein
MEFLFIGAATLLGVSVVLLIPKWLRYTASLNARKQEEAINKRWAK